MEKIDIRVAFSGPKFSGKDTIVEMYSNMLDRKLCILGQQWPRVAVDSFSDVLKKIAHDFFPFMAFDYSSEAKETLVVYKNPDTGVEYTPRMIWQALDVLPEIYPDVFVNQVERFITETDTWPVHIIKDVRRPAELRWVKANGFKLVMIETDDPRSLNATHKSESFYEMFREHTDYVIVNNKNVENYEHILDEQLVRMTFELFGVEL